MRGLVVSEVVDTLVPGLTASAFVEQWMDDAADWIAPADLDATWWLTVEHVYKRRRYDESDGSRLKVIGTAYRRDDFTTRAFFDYWRDIHGPISGRAPGLGAYVVSEVLERLQGDVEADGFVEQWWPDRAHPRSSLRVRGGRDRLGRRAAICEADRHVLDHPGARVAGPAARRPEARWKR